MAKKRFGVLVTLSIILFIILLCFTFLRGLFPRKHIETIEKYCEESDTDTNLVLALIKAESNFREYAVSHADARGLMQLTDDTFDFCNSSLGVKDADIFNPDDNIRAGVWYLSYLLKRYDGNVNNAVAAYNAGAANVDKWLKDSRYSDDGKTLEAIPFDETRSHAKKIRRYTVIYEFLY